MVSVVQSQGTAWSRDRVVLLTGASGGIGRAIALRLAALGSPLVLTGRDEARLHAVREDVARYGVATLVRPADLEREGAGTALVADAAAWRGRLDVVIHSAGGARFTTFSRLAPAEFDAALRLNLQAPVEIVRAALPHVLVHDRSWVVLVNTIAAREPTPPRGSAYLSAKAGLLHFAEALFAELRDQGLSVTSILPDLTDTPLVPPSLGHDRNTLLQPDSVARAVEFALLASPDACVEEVRLRPQPSLRLEPMSS